MNKPQEWDPLPEAMKSAAGVAALAAVALLVARDRAHWYYDAWERWIVPHLTDDTMFLEDWRVQALAVFPLVFLIAIVPAYQIVWRTRVGVMRRQKQRAGELMRAVNQTPEGKRDNNAAGGLDPADAVDRFGRD